MLDEMVLERRLVTLEQQFRTYKKKLVINQLGRTGWRN
jgi:hypothetical protein